MSDAEREVLKALWELGPSTVRQMRELLSRRGRRWAHTTISTLLSRMVEKSLVERDTSGFAHIYSAAVSRDAVVQQRLCDLADKYCDGRSVPLMLALAAGHDFSEQEIEQFRKLIDQLDQGNAEKRQTRKRSRRKKRT